MKNIVIISMILVVVGVAFVSGSLFMVPYTVRERVRVERSKVWADESFVLTPFGNRAFGLDSIVMNVSIFEIVLLPSSPIVFRIIDDTRDELVFEWLRGGTIFWTPPSVSGIWDFSLENPSSTLVNVSMTITEFYVKATEDQNVTYYRSFLDPVYGFSGIIAIIVGTALNLTLTSCRSRDQNQNIDSASQTSLSSIMY